MSFLDVVLSTNDYNFHSHTQYCDGRASMKKMTQAAIDAGLSHYGFTPHSPIACESGCNMSYDSVRYYVDEVKRLREFYGEQIQLYTSMEIDFLSRDFGPHIDYFQDLSLDYRLASVHFVPNYDGVPIDCDGRFERFRQRLHEEFHDDLRYVVEKFFEHTLTMIELGGFDVLGHFDKIAHNASLAQADIEEQSWYSAYIDDVISKSKYANLAIEVNTKAYVEHGRLFPSTRWLEKVLSAGLTVVVNSDAHYPEKIDSGRKEAFQIIKELCSNEL